MLRRLLQYLTEHSIEARRRELKEYSVRVDVLERGPEFDPRTDTIVRAIDPIRHMADELPNCAGHLGFAHASLGNRAEATRLLQLLLDHATNEWAPWIDIAAIYAGLGEAAPALDWLERGYRHRCFDVLFLRDDPRFDILRDDARFKQLAERTVPDQPTGGVRC